MRKFGKIILVLLLVTIAGAGAGVGYLFTAFPKVQPAQEVKIESTPELLARGKYLANHVALCEDCHSERDWSKFAAPMLGHLGAMYEYIMTVNPLENQVKRYTAKQ